MEAWADFWQIVIYGAIGLFTLLSIWVTIAGVGDIKRMFASLRAEETGSSEDVE